MSVFDKITFSYLEYKINALYSKRFLKYGTTPKGIFWKNSFTQLHRFELIFNLICQHHDFNNSIICDVGCGYGKLIEFLETKLNKSNFYYQGCDLNPIFVDYCKKHYSNKKYQFYNRAKPHGQVDFSIMSGTFNLCVTDNIITWEKYLLKNLSDTWRHSSKVMAFNLLHSNERKIVNGLYYTNKDWIKKVCERNFNKTETFYSPLLGNDILIIVKR